MIENAPPDAPSTLEVQEVKRRSVSGVMALISRTFIIQIISFVATLALTIFLDPNTYGVFYLVSSVVNFLAYFSDVGLAAALIQKKEGITKEDLSTTFTVQQILVISLLVILFILSPLIRTQYRIDQTGMYLLYAMGISLFLSSLKTIPSIMLEREIKFSKLILPQVLETLTFNAIAVFCAWRGLGVTSFTLAVLGRGVVGLIAMYLVYPWRPSFGISRSSLSHLLRFGLPYQVNTFLAVLKDDGMTIILTRIIGTQGLGYIGWASRWAGLPLRIVMDNLTKVAFPTFARLQHDKVRLAKAVEVSLKYMCLLAFPILVGMGFLALPVTHLIPRYVKWLPAIIPLYIYLYNSAWASISTSLTNLLNATGHIKSTFKLMLMWTGLTWLTMPFMAIKFGYLGVAYATGIIATSSLVTILLAKKHVDFNFFNIIKTPILALLPMSFWLYLSVGSIFSFLSLALIIIISIAIYFLAILILEGKLFFLDTLSYFKIKHV
ncbi:MAG: Polysaccharide biosynthesis protein [Candidatus Collierbacteria bacterium GW2011_GWC2_44_18]|uniref:Polysaccharide biosynthesis protein n=2 Tax=Microgenomates group TaxID=1794810 RepID=A0A0G1J6J5_9BACT|nr:MAG: Polysaccharide biosynthesis protein [Microgenomates group bacterium GW2011_GWC1_44_10]KKT49644.1 MAG: Polysaccharide biosynthesis protein [Candidatus Collierbacteria bacterium GW2011_GWC2_44_18]KKT67251.1 MAG: Polysaccharide biosynthesis protein [Candidatus Woesebacteria bacterium GW2011_GWA2_44_33]